MPATVSRRGFLKALVLAWAGAAAGLDSLKESLRSVLIPAGTTLHVRPPAHSVGRKAR
ncbi:MAG TPA: hypothetical protein DCM05_00550 [Elusimicrobia bacterium]|nr:hypothetical protein [Elusimicrobiota bacterium]